MRKSDDSDAACSPRAAGSLIGGGKIYLQKEKSGSEYAIPGGHVSVKIKSSGKSARAFCMSCHVI